MRLGWDEGQSRSGAPLRLPEQLPWPSEVSVPPSWTVWATETEALLSVAVMAPSVTAALFMDLHTRERAVQTTPPDTPLFRVGELLGALAGDRDRYDRSRNMPVLPLPHMTANQFDTWTFLQQLAATTDACWIPPPTFGAGAPHPRYRRAYEFRRVNAAIRRRVQKR